MPLRSFHRGRRTHAQSMVEFALVLPILLMIIYGLLEVGRAIFIYSIVTSASRDAVRYGSATGLNVTGGVEYYKDCAGIKAAAQNVDFLSVIDDANINISYDHGPDTSIFSGCPPASVATGDRITASVCADFQLIAMNVPLSTTLCSQDPMEGIRSTSSRTIINVISIP
jgi:Flp pilus assembly protein TadG